MEGRGGGRGEKGGGRGGGGRGRGGGGRWLNGGCGERRSREEMMER